MQPRTRLPRARLLVIALATALIAATGAGIWIWRHHAKPTAAEPDFDRLAVSNAMFAIAGSAQSCKRAGGPTGTGHVLVTFATSGHATRAQALDAFAATPTGACVEQLFRAATVPPFTGSSQTVQKQFVIQ